MVNNKPKSPDTEELLDEFAKGQPSQDELYRDYLDSEDGQAIQNDDDSVDEQE